MTQKEYNTLKPLIKEYEAKGWKFVVHDCFTSVYIYFSSPRMRRSKSKEYQGLINRPITEESLLHEEGRAMAIANHGYLIAKQTDEIHDKIMKELAILYRKNIPPPAEIIIKEAIIKTQ